MDPLADRNRNHGASARVTTPESQRASKSLQTEVAALANPQPGTTQAAAPAAVRAAATAVSETLRTFVPAEPRPPNATELQNLIDNGGRHFEAKLARLISDPTDVPRASEEPTEQQAATDKPGANKTTDCAAATSDRTADPTARAVGSDLKGDLLRLLQAVRDLGGAVSAPAAEGALSGIESQQSRAVAGAGERHLVLPSGSVPGQWGVAHAPPRARTAEPAGRPELGTNRAGSACSCTFR